MGLIHNLPGMAYRCRNDRFWTMEFVSAGCETLTGYAPDDLVDNDKFSFAELIHPGDRQEIWHRVQQALDDDRPYSLEYRIRTRDGSICHVAEHGAAVRDEDGEVVALEGFILDVTDRKALEHELRQAQKLEALGQLAGVVAHDFNNMLAAISGYAGLAQRSLDPGHQAHADLDQVIGAARQASGLTRQLLAFSRQQPLETSNLVLDRELEECRRILERLVREDVEVIVSPGAGDATVRTDRSYIQQILINLLVNAADAMPSGGTVTIETAVVDLTDDDAREAADTVSRGDLSPGERLRIRVSDTGTGIPPEVRSRIFDRFFTTKASAGTGLGLSTVRRIVEELEGGIRVASRPGEGSRFDILLPPGPPEIADEADPGAGEEVPGGHETVLVAEDEAAVLALAHRILEERGYRVLTASDATEASRVLDRASVPIDLLVTDTIMPGRGGDALATEFRRRHPEARILYMSGYLEERLSPGALEAMEGGNFLWKPFTPDELAWKVRRTLDA